MTNQYYDAGRIAVCVNYKAASATLARAIIATYHPDLNRLITSPPGGGKGTAYPDGRSADSMRWHALCPKIVYGTAPHTLLVVRNPVDRFVSACAETGMTDVDAVLNRLESGTEPNAHFWPQSRFAEDSPTLYRFGRDLKKLADDLDLQWPLPNIIRRDKPTKPMITQAQADQVLQIYADDLTLYQSTE